MKLSILYRGPLSSCNYGCEYCPFAKHHESDAEHQIEALALERFLLWVEARRDDQISVFFTPWGEALVRRRYQRALVRLTQMPHVEKAAIQSNGSCRFDWIEECDKTKLGLWLTFHPTQARRARFVETCRELIRRQARFSVGVVGLKEHRAEIEALRRELPPEVYVWINAFKRIENYYDDDDLRIFEVVDPLFPVNNQRYASFDQACRTGESVISVDGEGEMRRCHFIKTRIGNIYDSNWRDALRPRLCTQATCGCHIGYVHMNDLKLYETFGDGVLERIPQSLGQIDGHSRRT